jgi:hypothetical protein
MPRSIFALSLFLLLVCVACSATPGGQPPSQANIAPPVQPTIQHYAAQGCRGEHDTLYLAGGNINAYPGWPPNAQPEHIVLHYDNGETIWGKPLYGVPDCVDYMSCRRATFILNPTYAKCTAQGHVYEVATLDGKLVLESSLLQISDPATKGTVYVGFACGRGFAGPDVVSVVNQVQQSGCMSGSSQSQPPVASPTAASNQQTHPYLNAAVEVVGIALVAAGVLGTAYFSYRAAQANAQAQEATYSKPVFCTTTQVGRFWNTTCQ